MPRTRSVTPATAMRRRITTQTTDARLLVTQITQLVAANEQLQRTNRELSEENRRLGGELAEIGSALGGLPSGRRGRGRRSAAALAPPEAKRRRQRRQITDPDVLTRRNAALGKARAARAEKIGGGAGAIHAWVSEWTGRRS